MTVETVRLKEVCDVIMGQAPKGDTYNSEGIGPPLLAGAGDLGEIEPIPSRFTTKPTRLAKPGDIILCVRATLGKTNWARRTYCLGRGVASLRANPQQLNSGYLWHWIATQGPNLERQARGSTFHQVTRDTVESLRIPLPPLPEQRRIAAILDKADAIRRKRQQTLDLADQFLRSAFLDMFGDPVTNPKRWPVKKLGEIASITTGNTPSRKEPEYYGTAIEWIKSDNINTPSHFLTPATESLSIEGKEQGRTARAGATLITCIAGSRSCIGNVALTDREVAFNQQINAIEPGESLDPDFLYMQLLLAQRLIQAASTDSMKGLVSKGRLAKVRIPVPLLVSQKRFSAAFRAELDVVQRLEEGAACSALLFHSLVQRAFQGELP